MSYGKRITWLRNQSKQKNIVLFDMDGTLTPPRGEMSKEIMEPLMKLSSFADIGIVTGSDIDYLQQQMSSLIEVSNVRYKLHLLPCNGTKHYKPPKYATQKHSKIYEANMKEHVGYEKFNQIMKILFELQIEFSREEIPLTGHFINYRESMINWCPIGRNASQEEREKFQTIDTASNPSIRMKYLHTLKNKLSKAIGNECVVKLGGETSFDIYPYGWDKTYALKHFNGYNHIFVGDRCYPNGNDYEIFNFLKKNGFSTENPANTADIIINKIIPMLS